MVHSVVAHVTALVHADFAGKSRRVRATLFSSSPSSKLDRVMPKLPTIFSKRSTASADDLEKQAGAARKASMLESMEMAEAIEMLHISTESVVSFMVLLRSSRTQEVKELLLGVGAEGAAQRDAAAAAPAGAAAYEPVVVGAPSNLLCETHPVFNIRPCKVRAALRAFGALPATHADLISA